MNKAIFLLVMTWSLCTMAQEVETPEMRETRELNDARAAVSTSTPITAVPAKPVEPPTPAVTELAIDEPLEPMECKGKGENKKCKYCISSEGQQLTCFWAKVPDG